MIYTITSKSNQIEWGLKGDERIVQNVLNLIRTKMFEVPFMYDVGIDPDALDNKMAYAQANLEYNIKRLIERHEPRAKILSVKILDVDENGNTFYEVEVEV